MKCRLDVGTALGLLSHPPPLSESPARIEHKKLGSDKYHCWRCESNRFDGWWDTDEYRNDEPALCFRTDRMRTSLKKIKYKLRRRFGWTNEWRSTLCSTEWNPERQVAAAAPISGEVLYAKGRTAFSQLKSSFGLLGPRIVSQLGPAALVEPMQEPKEPIERGHWVRQDLKGKAEREEDRLVLLMLGRDDLLLAAYLR